MPDTWSRDKVREVLHELAKLPDWDLVPIPEKLCEEYKIPFKPSKVVALKDYLTEYKKSLLKDYDSYEIRKSDGIIRVVKATEQPDLIICKPEEADKYLTLTNQTDGETAEQPRQNQDIPTESIVIERQE